MKKEKKYSGLTEKEVIESREKYGSNELEKKKKENFLQKILHIFTEPMFLLLIITASIYFILGDVGDGIIMLCFVLFISGIEFVQERKTDRALDALNTLSSLNIKVIRNGEITIIDSKDIVVGDIVFLEEGDKISADGAILECQGLGINESALTGESDVVYKKLKDNKLEFVGLIALVDPPRSGVKGSIKSCYTAGVRVIMITGDNGETAKGVAKQINLSHNENVITGLELEEMSDDELKERVKDTNIFARVYPNHKMRIVKALQENNEVVAMTGDGVNDAPALKKAEIGIAMGKRGTNVAKEAADMILMDDNFNTIVGAIKNGRTIYNNIKKAISYILVIHIPIAFASLFAPLFNLPALLLPIHIVLLELIIDPTSSIIFQRLKPDSNVMMEKPRKISDPIINKKMLSKVFYRDCLSF